MKSKFFHRIIVGLVLAIPLAVGSAVLTFEGQAAPDLQGKDPNCQVCHEPTHKLWEDGLHGQAATDPVFLQAWSEQGEPIQCLTCHASGLDPETGDAAEMGVTCVACHGQYIEGHPAEPMPTYRSATTCSQCHSETHTEWQTSSHSGFEGGCIDCHDPHAADIRAEDASSLCSSCHQTTAEGFSHNIHNSAGLTCADCHLDENNLDEGDIHAARDHSFSVSLSSCTQCHDFHSHEDWEIASVNDSPPDVASAEVETQSEPAPISPVGYSALVGIFGLAGGMILTPWLEKLYKRIREDE